MIISSASGQAKGEDPVNDSLLNCVGVYQLVGYDGSSRPKYELQTGAKDCAISFFEQRVPASGGRKMKGFWTVTHSGGGGGVGGSSPSVLISRVPALMPSAVGPTWMAYYGNSRTYRRVHGVVVACYRAPTWLTVQATLAFDRRVSMALTRRGRIPTLQDAVVKAVAAAFSDASGLDKSLVHGAVRRWTRKAPTVGVIFSLGPWPQESNTGGRGRAMKALEALEAPGFLGKFALALGRRDRSRFHSISGHVRLSSHPVLYSEHARTQVVATAVAIANAEAIAEGAAQEPKAGSPGLQPILLANVEQQVKADAALRDGAPASGQPPWALAAQHGLLHRVGPTAPSKIEGLAIGLALAVLFNVLLVQVVLPTFSEGSGGGGGEGDYALGTRFGGEAQSLFGGGRGLDGVSLRTALSSLDDDDYGDGVSPRSRAAAEKKRLSIIMETSVDVSEPNSPVEPPRRSLGHIDELEKRV